jgi:hypothetical protein
MKVASTSNLEFLDYPWSDFSNRHVVTRFYSGSSMISLNRSSLLWSSGAGRQRLVAVCSVSWHRRSRFSVVTVRGQYMDFSESFWAQWMYQRKCERMETRVQQCEQQIIFFIFC